MRTADDVLELGLYSSDCCDDELIFDIGDTFTRCPGCEGLCTWDLVESLVLPDQLEIEVVEVPQAA